MPTKASSPTKNKGKVFFVAKSSGLLLGRLPLNGLQVVRAQVRFFQSVPRSEETHDLSVVKQWIG